MNRWQIITAICSNAKKEYTSLSYPLKQDKLVRSTNVQVEKYPSWRFSTVDRGGPFARPKGAQAELEIVNKLHDFDSMPWAEIEGRDHHFLEPSSLSKKANVRLIEINRDDEIDSIFSFYLRGVVRLICIRDRNIAKLLWFDTEHQVCPSTKR